MCAMFVLACPSFCAEGDQQFVSPLLRPEDVQPVEETPAEPEIRVHSIEFSGNRLIDSNEILMNMTLQEGDAYSVDTIQENLKRIYNMGYFNEKIKAVPLKVDDRNVKLKILVEENIPITGFTVTGNDSLSTSDIMKILDPLVDKPQNIIKINEAIEQIQDLYASEGYILARVVSVTDDPDGVVNIDIDEGTIGSITIEGNKKTKDFVVKRNVLTQPGTVYNENIIKQDLMRLYGTQAFKDVRRTIEQDDEDPGIYNVTIHLEEQRTGTLSLGAGLDTATGFFGSGGFTDNNFRGNGQRVSLNVLAGTGIIMADNSMLNRANLQAEVSFFEPRLKGTDNALLVKAFGRDFASYQVPLSIEQRFGIEATISRLLNEEKTLTGSFSVGLENVHVKEGDANQIERLYAAHNIPISERAKQLEGGLFLSISPALIYDTRDSAVVTRRGTMASLRFDEEFGLDGFDKTHGKLSGMIKQYIPIAKKSSLSFTVKGGGKIHGDDMPEVMAYRLGGPYTIRGFKMSGVGTGDAFIMGSAEFATPIPFLDRTRINFLHNLRFTVWVDAGKVFNGADVTNTIYDRPMEAVTAGIGLKLYVPGMGPLSIDYGIPLTNPGENGNRNGYFTFGVGDILY